MRDIDIISSKLYHQASQSLTGSTVVNVVYKDETLLFFSLKNKKTKQAFELFILGDWQFEKNKEKILDNAGIAADNDHCNIKKIKAISNQILSECNRIESINFSNEMNSVEFSFGGGRKLFVKRSNKGMMIIKDMQKKEYLIPSKTPSKYFSLPTNI